MIPPDFKLRAPNGDVHPITGPFRIGRGKECQVQVDNKLASRIHASIWIDNGQLLVRDERSRNGTQVNGRRLPPGAVHRLFDGDRLQIAGTTYLVESPPLPEPPLTVPPSAGFVGPPRPAAKRVELKWVAVVGGCLILIVWLSFCLIGGFLLTGPGRPIIATALAPRGAAAPPALATPAPTWGSLPEIQRGAGRRPAGFQRPKVVWHKPGDAAAPRLYAGDGSGRDAQRRRVSSGAIAADGSRTLDLGYTLAR